jgi:hypothetical protein
MAQLYPWVLGSLFISFYDCCIVFNELSTGTSLPLAIRHKISIKLTVFKYRVLYHVTEKYMKVPTRQHKYLAFLLPKHSVPNKNGRHGEIKMHDMKYGVKRLAFCSEPGVTGYMEAALQSIYSNRPRARGHYNTERSC